MEVATLFLESLPLLSPGNDDDVFLSPFDVRCVLSCFITKTEVSQYPVGRPLGKVAKCSKTVQVFFKKRKKTLQVILKGVQGEF